MVGTGDTGVPGLGFGHKELRRFNQGNSSMRRSDRHALHAATFPYKDAVRRNVCFPQIAESNRNIRGPF